MPAGSATKHRNLQKRMDLREAHKGGTKRLTYNPNRAMEEAEMPETNAIQAAYERFKLEWMLAHGYTLKDLIDELEQLRKESPELSLESIFHDWEFEYGFNTEIWPCFEEFLDCEYREMEDRDDGQQ